MKTREQKLKFISSMYFDEKDGKFVGTQEQFEIKEELLDEMIEDQIDAILENEHAYADIEQEYF